MGASRGHQPSFPALLEGKEVLIGEGVDTDAMSQPSSDAPVTEETAETSSDEEGSIREEPRRSVRQAQKPAWFKDYVSS